MSSQCRKDGVIPRPEPRKSSVWSQPPTKQEEEFPVGETPTVFRGLAPRTILAILHHAQVFPPTLKFCAPIPMNIFVELMLKRISADDRNSLERWFEIVLIL